MVPFHLIHLRQNFQDSILPLGLQTPPMKLMCFVGISFSLVYFILALPASPTLHSRDYAAGVHASFSFDARHVKIGIRLEAVATLECSCYRRIDKRYYQCPRRTSIQ